MNSIGSVPASTPFASPLTQVASPLSPTDGKTARDLEKARATSAFLKAMQTSSARNVEDRKASAKGKLDQLKEKLRQLQMYGGTPRQIAALAKELAAIAKEYASAGGGGGGPMDAGAAPADAGAATAAAGADAGAAASATAAAEGASPLDPDATADQVAQAQVATEKADGEAKVEGGAETEGQDGDKTEAADGEKAPETPYDKAIRAQKDDAERQNRIALGRSEDSAFGEDIGKIARELKAMAKRAAEKAALLTAGATGKGDDKAAEDETKQALGEADRELQKIGGGAGPGVSITV